MTNPVPLRRRLPARRPAHTETVPTPAAERQRRHRERRKQGRFVVPIEVTGEMVQALVDQGDVDEGNSSNLDCVGEAIAAAARRGLDLT